jgi:hypothetical protein
MRKLLFSSTLLATSCAVFYHKEVVEVPDPAALADPQIAAEASGAKLVFRDLRTGKTEKTKFLNATDSSVKVLRGRAEREFRPSQMSNARLEFSAAKTTPPSCLSSACCGITFGGVLGWLAGKSVYDDITEDAPTPGENPSCIDVIILPLIYLLVLFVGIALAVIIGAAVAGLILLLSLILGNIVLPNLFLNPKVKEIKSKANRLRSLIAHRTGG